MAKHHYFSIIYYDCREDLEFLDEELDLKFNNNSEIRSPEPVEILLTIANLNRKSTLSEITKILEENDHIKNFKEYVKSVYSSLVSCFGTTVADLLMLNWRNDDKCTTIVATRDSIIRTAECIFSLAVTFCHSISSDFGKGENTKNVPRVINAISVTLPPDILYHPIPALSKLTGKIVYCDCFYADSSTAALYLCFVLTVKGKKQLRCCKVCGKYFIPSAKSNEIYCRDCRKTTYDTKIKQDEVLRAYRTIYKTQNARKRRNLHRPHIVEKFEKWKEYAKMKLQQCQNQEITLEDMQAAISSDDWIHNVF